MIKRELLIDIWAVCHHSHHMLDLRSGLIHLTNYNWKYEVRG